MRTALLAVAACVSAVLSVQRAGAVEVTLGTLSSDVAAYNTWSRGCAAYINASGTPPSSAGQCAPSGAPTANGNTLFSWGTVDNLGAVNSVRTLTYSGTDSIRLQATNGLSLTATGSVGNAIGGVIQAGTGATTVWEWGGTAPLTSANSWKSQFGEAQVRVSVRPGTSGAVVEDFSVLQPYPASSTYFSGSPVLQTPLNNVGYNLSPTGNLVINPGDQVQFRFFETIWNGATLATGAANPNPIPDLIYAPITAALNGSALTATVETSGSTNFRVGSGTDATVTAAAKNVSDAGVVLKDVQFGAGSNGFTPTSAGPGTPTEIAVNATSTRDYTVAAPTALGEQKTANVAVTYTQGSATANLSVTGVGPQTQMYRGTTAVAQGETIVDLGRVRQGTVRDLSSNDLAVGSRPNLSNIFAQDLGTPTQLNVGATTPGNGQFSVTGLAGASLAAHGGNQAFALGFQSTGSEALGKLESSLAIQTDQNAKVTEVTQGTVFGYKVAADIVGPQLGLKFNGSDIAGDGTGTIALGQIRQGRAVSTDNYTLANRPTVVNTELGIADSLTVLGIGNTTPGSSNLTVANLAGTSIAANNGSQMFKLGLVSTATPGAFTTGLTINTNQGTEVANTNGGEAFNYNVTGTIVQSAMGIGMDPKDTGVRFDLSGQEVVFDPDCPTCVGRIDLGGSFPNIRQLVINNILAGLDEQVGLTIGDITFTGDTANFLAKGYTSPPTHFIAGQSFFDIDVEYLPLVGAGGLLNIAAADHTAIMTIHTDNGAALGRTNDGTTYSFLLTGTAAPEPGTLALFAAALFLPGLRRITRGRCSQPSRH